jgi:DNA-binding NarL/FixJ family response regulator
MKTTVLIAEDHTIVRQGLKALINSASGLEVIGEAATGREAVAVTRKVLPDVVVMDFAMPELNGLEATKQISKESPSTRVLILSCHGNEEYVQGVIAAGAVGFLMKQTASTELITAIRQGRRGNPYFSPSIARKLQGLRRNRFPGDKTLVRLTMREAEMLQLIAEGYATKQIADRLSISIKTVEKHRQSVMDKLKIHQIAGLTRYAVEKGVIQLGGNPVDLAAANSRSTATVALRPE